MTQRTAYVSRPLCPCCAAYMPWLHDNLSQLILTEEHAGNSHSLPAVTPSAWTCVNPKVHQETLMRTSFHTGIIRDQHLLVHNIQDTPLLSFVCSTKSRSSSEISIPKHLLPGKNCIEDQHNLNTEQTGVVSHKTLCTQYCHCPIAGSLNFIRSSTHYSHISLFLVTYLTRNYYSLPHLGYGRLYQKDFVMVSL